MRGRTVSYLLAAFLWVLCAYQLCLVAWKAYQGTLDDMPVLGALLADGHRANSITSLLILAVFGWVLLEIFLHALRILQERSGVLQLQGWSRDVLHKSIPGARASMRARLVADNLATSPAQLHETLPAAAALDANQMENTYALTKAFVWILPVLGFIGTAWGMSHAINGFSQALQETSDIKVLTDRLSQLVIPNLGNAFAVTMVALGASIVGHFCVSAVQNWDAAVLQDLDRACVSLLAKVPKPGGTGLPGNILEKLLEQLQAIGRQFGELHHKLDLTNPANQLAQAAQTLSASAQQLDKAGKTLQELATLPYNITITRGNTHAQ